MSQPFTTWINLAPRQLAAPELVDSIAVRLAQHQLPPAALGLEITEGALLEDMDSAVLALERLSALGVRLAVDDFGTGYSSLSYLKRLPVDVVKIDRSFVDGVADDSQDAAIVRGVIGMTHALHLSVVAEGVETAEQLAALRRLGCDIGQGYLLGRPMPQAAIDMLLGLAPEIPGQRAPALSPTHLVG